MDETKIDNWYRATGSSRSSVPAPLSDAAFATASRELEFAPRKMPVIIQTRCVSGRTVIAIIVFNLAIIGLSTEQATHLCHDFFEGRFDPLGNPLNTVLFLVTAALLTTNEWLLGRRTQRHSLSIASLIGTGIALGVTVTMGWFFLPLLFYTFTPLLWGGLSVLIPLIWIPYLTLIVLALQGKALAVRLREIIPSRACESLCGALLMTLLTIAWFCGEAAQH